MADKSLGFSITASDRASATFAKMALQVDRLAERLDALDRKRTTVTVDADTSKATAKIAILDKSFGASTIRIAALGRAMGQLALPAALVAATPAIASLGASAITASGALWLLPAAAVAGGVAFGALKVGMAGFGDAMKNMGDPAKFAEAIAKLSPAARDAANAVRGLVPEWTAMQQVVQQNLFAGVAASIGDLAGKYLPILQAGLGGTAVELNRLALGVAGFFAQSQTMSTVAGIFEQVRLAMAALSGVGVSIASIFVDIAAVGATFLPGLAGGFAASAASAAAFIANARETGQLRVWIQGGLDTLAQLGRISANVGSILKSVFDGAKTSGGSFLGTLEMITNRIATGLQTPAGAAGLQEFFGTVRTLVGLLWDKLVLLWPVVAAGAEAFAKVLVAAAPLSDVVFRLVVAGLVPLLDVVGWLAPVLGPLAVVLGIIKVAVMAWTAAQWLLNVALSLNPLGIVVVAIAALVAALILAWNHSETFRNIVIGVWNAIKTAAVAVFTFLRDFFVGTWNSIVSTVTTVWNGVVNFFTTIWNTLVGFFGTWGPTILAVIAPFIGIPLLIAQHWDTISAFFVTLWNGIVAFFSGVWNTIRTIALTVWDGIVTALGSAFNIFKTIFVVVWGAIAAVFLFVWEGIRHTAVTVWNAISGFFSAAFAAYSALFSRVWNAISAVFTTVWNFIRNTATTVWNAIVGFFTPAFSAFSGFFSTVWNAISTVFMTVWNNLRNTAVTVWTAISGFFSAAFAVFSAFFSTIWNAIWTFFVNTWNNLRNTAVNAWNIIVAFFQGAFAVFTQFFVDTWNNIVGAFDRIWSGITAIATRVWDNVKGAFVGAINWIIDKINFFAGAINKVAGLLGFNINLHVDRLALGGEVAAVRRAFGGAIEAKQVIRRATGGGVDATAGGRLPYTGTRRDTLPARAGAQPYLLQGEEWIIRRDSARTLGAASMNAINNADRRPVDVVPRAQRQRMAHYRDGGALAPIKMATAGQLAGAAAAGVPGTRMSSGFRPGDPGMHGKNQAADLVGNLGAINRWIADNHGRNTTQLIYTPGINLLNGRPHTYNAATRADHYDHVHWGMAGSLMGGGIQGLIGGLLQSGYEALLSQASGLLDPLRNILVPIRDDPRQNYGMRFGAGIGVKLIDHLFATAAEKDAAAGANGMDVSGISGPVVEQVRQVAHRYGWGAGPQWDALAALVQKESGWNPNAANPRSSARGLFQKMTSIHGPVEPTAAGQAAWGLNYIRGRYRDPIGAWGFHRAHNYYDNGGVATGRGLMFKDVITPERVLSGRQTVAFEELVAGLVSGRPQRRLADVGVLEQLAAAQSVRRGSLVSAGGGGDRALVEIGTLMTPQGVSADQMAGAVMRSVKVAKHGGRYRR